jgi:hypothetical protein
MQKNFLLSAAVVIVITGLIGFGQHSKEVASQRRYDRYQHEEQQKEEIKQSWWKENSAEVEVINSSINECLAKYKPVETEIKTNTEDVFTEYFMYQLEYMRDSTERASMTDEEKAELQNELNTLILDWGGASQGEELFNFTKYMEKYHGVHQGNTYTRPKFQYSLLHSKGIKEKEPLKDIKYLVLLNNTSEIKPKMSSFSETFEAGAIVTKYKIYNLKTTKEIKEGTIVSTNSEEMRVPTSMAQFYLRNDLAKNRTTELFKTLFDKQKRRR